MIVTDARKTLATIAAFAAIYVVWGSTYLAIALALQSLPPFLLMAARCLMGSILLFLIARATGRFAPSLATWALASLCGILFFVGCHGVLAYAQQHMPSGFAAVLLATIPLWIALFQAVLPGEQRPGKNTAACLSLGIAGVALIAWRETSAGGDVGTMDILLLLGASASWAAGTLLSRRYSKGFPPMALSSMELFAGGMALLLLSLLRGELTGFAPTNISLSAFGGLLYLTLAGTVVAFAAYTWLLTQVSPTLVATYTFVNPIIAVLLGWAFMGEQPTLWMLAGAVMVIASVAGVLLTQRTSGDEGKKTAIETGAIGVSAEQA
jgi:drug/metabolite transporter (DMT)-like permease